MTNLKSLLLLISAIVLFSLGLLTGWKLWKPKPTPVPTYQPAIVQSDGSVAPEVKPNPQAKPNMQIPHGAVVDHQGSITVQPNPLPAIPGSTETEPLPTSSVSVSTPVQPPPVTIQWSLVTMPDGNQRMIFKTDSGKIIDAVDVPVRSAAPVKVLKNALGSSYNPSDKTWGVFYERDMGPFRLGVEALQKRIPDVPGQVVTSMINSNVVTQTTQTVSGKISWTGNLRLALRF